LKEGTLLEKQLVLWQGRSSATISFESLLERAVTALASEVRTPGLTTACIRVVLGVSVAILSDLLSKDRLLTNTVRTEASIIGAVHWIL
jgi:hypothetical protein